MWKMQICVWLYLFLSDLLFCSDILAPVIDSDFLPHEPHNLFHNAADNDYIAGINNMDGHIVTDVDAPSVNTPLVNTTASV